jgi:hypothetical protein
MYQLFVHLKILVVLYKVRISELYIDKFAFTRLHITVIAGQWCRKTFVM